MREIQLTQGYVAIVDEVDYGRVSSYKWSVLHVGDSWYAWRSVHQPKPLKPYNVNLHRFLLDAPKDFRVKFADGDGLNCRRENLRLVAPVNLIGRTFGKLTVIALAGKSGYQNIWLCRCECGAETKIHASAFRNQESCGCVLRQILIERNYKHGLTGTRVHHIWATMRQRCGNPENPSYPDYGGRGIVICERWATFENFYADMGDPPEAMTLERKDNDGPYAPWNCRWATRKEQNRNKRDNVFLTFDNRTQCISAWAEELGIAPGSISRRRLMGMPIERVLHRGNLNDYDRSQRR